MAEKKSTYKTNLGPRFPAKITCREQAYASPASSKAGKIRIEFPGSEPSWEKTSRQVIDKDSACRQGASRRAKGPTSSALTRLAGRRLDTKLTIRRQKTEGWAPGKILPGRPVEAPARVAPGKLPPPAQCRRSSASTSPSFRACLPGCVSRRWLQKGLSGAMGRPLSPSPRS